MSHAPAEEQQMQEAVRQDMARDASLEMKLSADSGYQSVEIHRISADQWKRIVAIALEPESN